MKITPVTDKLSVADQPSETEIAALAGRGVRLVINNRPDGEEAAQPGSAAERRAAEGAGMAYLDLPVTGPTITREAALRFHEAVEASPGPVLAHCRGGTRSLTLWVIGEVLAGRMRREDVRAFGTERGFDLSGVVAWLDANA